MTSQTYLGLCADCLHVRRVESESGSVFYRCDKARQEQDFPKYPPLPVLRCRGFEAATGNAKL